MKLIFQGMKKTRGIVRRISPAALLVPGGLACMVIACSASSTHQTPARRPLDAQPVKVQLSTPVPPGRPEALFELDTGADQMTQGPKEAGLVVVVRIGSDEFRQTIASCRDPGLGSALGGGAERVLEVAICDGEYWLISEPGTVTVMRVDREQDGEQIARFDLPGIIRAVRPSER